MATGPDRIVKVELRRSAGTGGMPSTVPSIAAPSSRSTISMGRLAPPGPTTRADAGSALPATAEATYPR